MARTRETGNIVNQERWLKLMSEFNFKSNHVMFNNLLMAYSEKHRQYHSVNHLKHVLLSFDESRHLAVHPCEVELALWFHDAVYKIFSSDNELQSAQLASKFLQQQDADANVIQKVHKHIMATLHDAECHDNDSELVVDIDLAILGTPIDIYQNFERNVRKEYRLIPRFIYQKKRKEILQGFLDRKSIYHHTYFRDKYESQARVNLESAIESL